MKTLKVLLILHILVLTFSCTWKDKDSILLCLGDSITESAWGNYPAHLDKLFKRNRISFTAISLGRPGNTSGEYLRYFKKSNVLSKYNPDLIVLMLGTNDVRIDHDNTPTREYKKNMLKIIDIIRTFEKKNGGKIDIFICTIPPLLIPSTEVFTKKSAQRIEEEIIPTIEEIAEERGLKIIDIHSMFMNNKDLIPGVHPSPGGYYRIAKTVFETIQK